MPIPPFQVAAEDFETVHLLRYLGKQLLLLSPGRVFTLSITVIAHLRVAMDHLAQCLASDFSIGNAVLQSVFVAIDNVLLRVAALALGLLISLF